MIHSNGNQAADLNERDKMDAKNGNNTSEKATTITHPAEIVEKFKRVHQLERAKLSLESYRDDPVNKRAKKSGNVTNTKKLLRWPKTQWQSFERIPQYARKIPSGILSILPIRCPLSSVYEIHYQKGIASNYSPSALMERFLDDAKNGSSLNNLGLVIDATGCDTFLHDAKEWADWDVEYKKLNGSFDLTSPDDAKKREEEETVMVNDFSDVLSKHCAGGKKEYDVAVFGLWGYNLVGFLIVSWMIEKMNTALDVALQQIATACPPGIYSMYYLKRLYRKYFNVLSDPTIRIACAAKPEWDTVLNEDVSDADLRAGIGPEILTANDRETAFVQNSTNSAERSKIMTPVSEASSTSSLTVPAYKPPVYIPPSHTQKKIQKPRKIRTWVEQVSKLGFGEHLDSEGEEYKQAIASLAALAGIAGFAGCEAISLTATHIGEEAYKQRGCLTVAYLVTWRARGRRCLLYLADEATYVVSRDMSLTKVNMKFPRRRAPSEFLTNTLVDGVLVEDQDHGHKVLRFLAFDIIAMEGAPIWQQKLEKRLQCLQNEVILPKKNDKIDIAQKEPFRIRMKDHFRLSKTEYLLQSFVECVTHEVDGLVFTPTEAAYNLGGYECKDPVYKFISSENGGCGIPGLDGSITKRRLLEYIKSIPTK
ncbi:unnamed protein product [Albugo candida]|uniref:mRNA capping enzyme adenylation domain-containing protein n=1 Tax=Albugo candida TaxID=65357 RepID=A0A024GNE3_9STRA|nr:unnamed protein product [Albugo candida]|eukprot:CCI48398.1 unnamed protein product [Albugo candida]